MDAKNYANGTYKVLICDLIGLKFDEKGEPDPGEVRQYIEGLGEVFHLGGIQTAATFDAGRIHFFYQPNLSTEDELLTETSDRCRNRDPETERVQRCRRADRCRHR